MGWEVTGQDMGTVEDSTYADKCDTGSAGQRTGRTAEHSTEKMSVIDAILCNQ